MEYKIHTHLDAIFALQRKDSIQVQVDLFSTFPLKSLKAIEERRENRDKLVSATLTGCSSKSKEEETKCYHVN